MKDKGIIKEDNEEKEQQLNKKQNRRKNMK